MLRIPFPACLFSCVFCTDAFVTRRSGPAAAVNIVEVYP